MRKSKRVFGRAGVAALATLCVCATAASGANTMSFVSEPTLQPPKMDVLVKERGLAPGLIFVADFDFDAVANQTLPSTPGGPLILDNNGQPVFYRHSPATRHTLNTAAQTLGGKPVLTWWTGKIAPNGDPSFAKNHIVGSNYKRLKGFVSSLEGVNGWTLSMHEFLITKRGTALVTAYKVTPNQDLTPYGGPASRPIMDNAVQEYDLKTGGLVREWDFRTHISPANGFPPASGPGTWDPYHINSVDEDAEGNWLVSARNTWAIYKIDKNDKLVWTLGGKSSNFSVAPNAQFAFQHDARFRGANQITLFDNHCCAFGPGGKPQPPVYGGQSRAITLQLNVANNTAGLLREHTHAGLTAGTQGSAQTLPNGNVFVGWGQQPYFSEYNRAGKLLFDARFPGTDISFRARRFRWTGRPGGRPSAAARRAKGRTTVYASWNGATRVAYWQVRAGRTSKAMRTVVRRARRRGFETAIRVPRGAGPAFQVKALDRRRRALGTSKVVTIPRRERAGSPEY